MEMSQSQRRRVDSICHDIDDYLTLRLAQAERVNPAIGQFVGDLKAQILVNLRDTLTKGRAWGYEKFMIADILCGDDLTKRYEVFNTTGQYSILHDIVTSLDEHQHGADAIRIVDLRALYSAMDERMAGLIELAQTWVWWDLPDAVGLTCHNAQIARVKRLANMELNDQVKEYYKGVMGISGGEDITLEMIMGHEYRRMMRIVTEYEMRRRDELPHQQVLKRDIVDDRGVNGMILDLADEIRILNQIEANEALDPKLQEHCARRMATDPSNLTRDHVLHSQRRHVEEMEQKTHAAILTGQVLGPPYNYKDAQLDQMKGEVESVQPLISDEARHAAEIEEAADSPAERGPLMA